MYAICSTKKGDVSACVKEMKKQGHTFPLYQLSSEKYKTSEADMAQVPAIVGKLFPRHCITMKDRVLHRKMCKKTDGRKYILAAISRPSLTGLKKCSCMK
jgi:hypothetical protein